MGKTIQAACKTGGIPFEVCFAKPKRNRSNLILILDISGSCKEASEMMLGFMYLLKVCLPEAVGHMYLLTLSMM